MQQFVDSIEGIPDSAKAALRQLTPATYTGNAEQQAKSLQKQMNEL